MKINETPTPPSATYIRVATQTSPLLGEKYTPVHQQSRPTRVLNALNQYAIALHSIQGIDETASAISMSLKTPSGTTGNFISAVGASLANVEEGIVVAGASLNGVEETIVTVGKSASAIAGPAVSFASCVIATPIVALGAYGAVKECHTLWKKEYPKQLQEVLRSQDEVIKTFEAQGKTAAELSPLRQCRNEMEKFGQTPRIPFHQVKQYGQKFFTLASTLAKESENPSEATWHATMQYQQQEAQRHITRIKRDIVGPTNAIAMMGMASGLPVAGTGAITEIIGQAAIAHTAESVATGIFVPAQVAMMIAGAANATTGILNHKELEKDKQAITYLETPNTHHNPHLSTSLQQFIDQKQGFRRNEIASGVMTTLGQSMMLAGTVVSLTPGAVASPALFAIGAISTASASATEIISHRKENQFIGAHRSTLAQQQADQDSNTIKVSVQEQGIAKTVEQTATQHHLYQTAIAKIKFYSILIKVLREEEKNDVTSLSQNEEQQQRKNHIQQRIDKLTTHPFSSLHTSLLKADIKLINSGYRSGQYLEGLDDLRGNTAELKTRLLTLLQAEQTSQENQLITQLGLKDEVAREVLINTIKKLNALTKKDSHIQSFLSAGKNKTEKEISLIELKTFTQENTAARKIYEDELAKHVIAQDKTDAKFLRHETAEQLILLARTAQLIAQNKSNTALLTQEQPLDTQTDRTLLKEHLIL
ncbi:MAG: hypothetical protein IT497_09820 [Ottowia sp.]|nr:hypothetical protein [Ottowia sp.]